MDYGEAALVATGVHGWRVLVAREFAAGFRDDAQLVEDFGVAASDYTGVLFVGVSLENHDRPSLVVTQTDVPHSGGLTPGVLVVPETGRVFIGAGERVLCYRHDGERWYRQWEDFTQAGFWCWHQHDDIIVMTAELELAAWTLAGEKLWAAFVEPPWDYSVTDSTVRLDVMGTVSQFGLRTGPV